MITPDSISVASVPTGHPYVSHLDPVDPTTTRVIRLADPTPTGAEGTDRWWPPRWLDPSWLRAHLTEFDLLHLHFGFDALPVEQVQAVVDIVRDAGKPLVFTAHDLHNPHFVDNTLHTAHLDLLLTAADEVITLTPGAAREIEHTYGVVATVVPHPHIAPLELVGRPRPRSSGFVVGVHAKNIRANSDPLAVMDTLVEAVASLTGAVLRIDMDDTVFDDESRSAVGTALVGYGSMPGVDVVVHPRFDDAQLWKYLTDIDVSVLPYRFGTHSGWLEACHDVGTAAVVPDCGHLHEQRPCRSFGFGVDRFDPDSLVTAVRESYEHRGSAPSATRAARADEREVIARAHEVIYDRVLARAQAPAGVR